MKRELKKKAAETFLIVFLPAFMSLIFGPAEIFFSNISEFEFIYGDFAGYLVAAAFFAAVIVTAVLTICKGALYKIGISVIFAVSAAGYLQVMFLNGKLDSLGARPEGYQVAGASAVGNFSVWLIVLAAVPVMAFWKEKIWKTVVLYGSVFLLSIQVVAMISLLLTARDEAFHRKEGTGVYHFSGAEQYMVSGKENVIILILDYCSNDFLDQTKKVYPDVVDGLQDFTYYNNTDCNYFGTFPSFAHFLTGHDVNMEQKVNDWCYDIWNDEGTQSFYDMLHGKNFKTNIFSPDTEHFCGTNDAGIMKEEISNIVDSRRDVDIFYKLLFKTMVKMSCYRMAPELAKPLFYTGGDEYGKIVSYKEDKIDHTNYDFYESLLANGLKKDNKSNYFILQHLMGPHEYSTGADGHYKKDASREETVKGCFVIVEEYLNCLKKLGVYDNSTIIITADHGDMVESQVVFFIKEPGETHDAMKETNAPVSLKELRSTVAYEVGADPSEWGNSIYDFSEDEKRERTVWVRGGIEGYPFVHHYAEDRMGNANVCQGFTYTGDRYDLYEKWEEGPDVIVPLIDCFW